ncbi:MAG: hypothetical protein LC108_08325 [Anaerolineales bacterium]|nr:hypothetical protein [Anaerolineales bacterium]
MLKTWFALKNKTVLSLPEETTALIETVYGGDMGIQDEALSKELDTAIKKAQKTEREEIDQAKLRLIPSPSDDRLLLDRNHAFDEDDPTLADSFKAMTRLTDPTITLICLHQANGKIYLDEEDLSSPLDNTTKPTKDLTKELLRRSISVQHRDIVRYFVNYEPTWKGWNEVAALKYTIPIVFENGICQLQNSKYAIVLDRQTGITIQKETK